MNNIDPQTTVLTHAILASLAGALPTMDPRRIQSMGIQPHQADRIKSLTTAEITQLAQRGDHYISIHVDPDLLDRSIAEVDEATSQQALVLDFVRHDASREMMVAFFDISHRQHARLRMTLGLPPNPGRPKECTPRDAERIAALWEMNDLARDPKTLLQIATLLGLSLRTVWSELSLYTDDYEPAPAADIRHRDEVRILRLWRLYGLDMDPSTFVAIANDLGLPLRTVRDAIRKAEAKERRSVTAA